MANLAWINEQPALDVNKSLKPDDDSFQPRRSHSKSRNGCQGCKQRRIKCDESKPICGQCLHRKATCEFENIVSQHRNSSNPLDSAGASALRASATVQILEYLKEVRIPCSIFKEPVYKQGDGRELIDHFLDTTIPWLGSHKFQEIVQKDGYLLAIKAPYLLHAILSTSASHLSYLQPYQKKYEVAATVHYQAALRTYLSQLQIGINDENADAVFGCGYLQTMLAFENISRTSGEKTEGGSNVNYLRAMQGVKALEDTDEIRPYLERSIWLPVILESRGWGENTREHLHDEDLSSASTTSKALYNLCEVPINSLDRENPYQKALGMLCPFLNSEAGHHSIGKLIAFVGRLPNDFIELFEKNDLKAMLLIAYWLAFLCGVDQWWVVRSATAECRRLCNTLSSISDLDSNFRNLLQFPISRCQYIVEG